MPSTLAFTTLTLSLFLAATTTTNALPWNFKAFNRQQYSPPSWVPRNFVPANPTPAPYISGPELTVNFPDPCIIAVNGTYYSFATGSASANIPIAYSTDFVNWQLVLNDDGTETDALPIVGDWVNMVRAVADPSYSCIDRNGRTNENTKKTDCTKHMGSRRQPARRRQVRHVLLCHRLGLTRWRTPLC